VAIALDRDVFKTFFKEKLPGSLQDRLTLKLPDSFPTGLDPNDKSPLIC
jgi:hypothetical protein